MLKTFDADQRLEVARQKGKPVELLDDELSSLCTNQLWNVDPRWSAGLDDVGHLTETGHRCLTIALLEQSKAPVGGKLCVPDYHEVKLNGAMKATHAPPENEPHHDLVFVLATTVIAVHVGICLTKTKVREEVLEEANYSITSFWDRNGLIYEIVDLLGRPLAMNPEDAELSTCEEVHWARLEWVRGVVHLLGKVERIMHLHRFAACIILAQPSHTLLLRYQLGHLRLISIQGSFLGNLGEMSLLSPAPFGLVHVRQVCGSVQQTIVPLTNPADVGHRLAAYDVGAESAPEFPEGGICHSLVTYNKKITIN